MKSATFSKSAFAVTALLVSGLVGLACANSADVPAEDSSPTEPPPPAETKVPASTPASTPAPPEKKCAPTCATDSDCANSCPALAGGVQCCDTKTKTCWGSKTSACPAPVDTSDAGSPGPAY